ncbi:lysophospholipid acyltransferase family protein [Hyphomonas sp.]|uniref:lysophospholipid acyltransferase family protein n=2 Tax=Hyphomonas sp. TaxID=87 RepID=UPI0025C13823|nr:lysophospholipid acyltransferase family protein [Hyphomonas sp.]
MAKPTGMRVFTSLLFVVWLYLWMAILGILFLPALILPRWATIFGIRTYTRIVRLGLRLICGISTEIRGRENMPEGPVLYAGKHQCMYDVFIPFLVMRDPAIIMKKELLWYPFLGWYALKAAMIPIDRAGTTKTLKAMVGEAKIRAENYRQIVIFPEGTRKAPGAPPEYHAAGISALAKAIEAPIVPVATNAGLCWPGRGFLRRPGKIIYQILPPIPAGLPRKEMMAKLQGELEPATDALVKEGLAVQGRELPAA